jgi:flagellar assembly protein FliH
MRWTETIAFSQPLRDATLVRPDAEPLSAPPAAWEARLREREQVGFERGRVEGEKALSEQLLRQRADLLQMHQGVLESLRQVVPDLIRQTENTLLEVALEAASRLVGGLPITPEMVAGVVREAVGQVEEATEICVELHPEDLALLQQTQSPLLAPATGGTQISFRGSSEVTHGGCRVRTRFGIVDASRETKMDLLQKSLGLEHPAPNCAAIAPAAPLP